jgi:hypothetical protein
VSDTRCTDVHVSRRRSTWFELDDGHELVASLPRLLAEADRFLAGLPA